MPSSRGSWHEAAESTVPGAALRYFVNDSHGMRAILAATDEPIAQLHIVLATEADTNEWSHKDDGLPHTLEHAVFMGSKKYPIKGILDKLANRALADGTNAWTATDHTCYTMESAGCEGLLSLLPIYFDHVLNPTLTDECFTTEVHHVTGEGEDKGVVYCEMQGRENDASSLVDRACMQLLFPSGGYSAETGGILANLRDLTNEQVKRYHKEYYVPTNVLIVLSGLGIDEQAFVEALARCEERVVPKSEDTPPPPRPWTGPVCGMNDGASGAGGGGPEEGILLRGAAEGVAKTITFPSDDESVGTASMAWRGPTFEGRATFMRLQLLWKYLTDSAAAPLQKAFVECDEPICGDVAPADSVHRVSYLQVWFEDCEVDQMGEIPRRFFDAIKTARDAFDVERMRSNVDRFRRERVKDLENSPTNSVIDEIIQHFLYAPLPTKATRTDPMQMGEVTESLRQRLDPLAELPAIMAMEASDWQALIDEWILEPPCAAVLGYPSPKLVQAISDADEARTRERKETMGDEGLKAKAEALNAAKESNEGEIPPSILMEVPIPSAAGVKLIRSFAARGGGDTAFDAAPGSSRCDGYDEAAAAALLSKLNQGRLKLQEAASAGGGGSAVSSCWLECIHIESAFLQAAVAFDTSTLPEGLRLYVPLLLDMLFKADAILLDGERLSKDDFVNNLEAETVDYGTQRGMFGGRIKQMLSASVRVESSSSSTAASTPGSSSAMECALKWLRRALYCTRFKAKNVRTSAKRLKSECPSKYRDGDGMLSHVHTALTVEMAKSNAYAASPMMQLPFLESLLKRLDDEEGRRHVLSQLEALRTALVKPWRMQAFVAGNLASIDHIYEQVAEALTPPEGGWAEAGADSEEDEEEDEEEGEEEDGDEGEDDGEGKGGDKEGEGGGEGGAEAGDDEALLCGVAEDDDAKEDEGVEKKEGGEAATATTTATVGPLLELMEDEAETAAELALADKKRAASAGGAALVRGVAGKHITREGALTDGGGSVVLGLSAIESTFLGLYAPGVDHYHEDVCALRVVIEYLTALEGEFWVKLRGAGLTYGSSLSNDAEKEALSFSLYKCTDAVGAYNAAKQIVSDYASGEKEISSLELDGAKSTLTYKLISKVSTKEAVVRQSWASGYYPIDADYYPWLLEKLQHVTVADAVHALTKHIVPLFDASSLLVATCPSKKAKELASQLGEAHSAHVTPMSEQQLQRAFGPRALVAAAEKQRGPGKEEGEEGEEAAAPLGNLPAGRGRGRPAFGFAKQFKCECPKCDPEKRDEKVDEEM